MSYSEKNTENKPGVTIQVALPCEARPIIDHYRLKRQDSSVFAKYQNADASLALIVSGVGKLNAATALAYSLSSLHYPEHAGLLLARSVSEALSGDGSKVVIRDNMKAAVDYSLRKYDISMAEVNQLFVDLLRRTNDGLQAAIEPLLEVILERQKDGAFVLNDEVGIALSERSDSWDAKDRHLALQLSASIIMKNAAPILRSQSANITNSLKIIKG